MSSHDSVFKALNDPSRRRLLDELYENDGQTLSELCRHLPTMTRYGVMNHLAVLAEAGLLATAKVGRRKYHYLNAVPIQQVYDRWITKYTQPVTGAVTALKAQLEEGADMTDQPDDPTKPIHVHETYIAAPSERVWAALTDGASTVDYFHGTVVESSWAVGTPVRYRYGPGDRHGEIAADGEVLAVEVPTRLEMTFHPRWDPALEAEGPARMVWLLADVDGLTHLRIEYFDIDPDGLAMAQFRPGIAHVAAGLKTLVETGSPMVAAS